MSRYVRCFTLFERCQCLLWSRKISCMTEWQRMRLTNVDSLSKTQNRGHGVRSIKILSTASQPFQTRLEKQ